MTANRFETVIRLIDEAHAADPTTVMVRGAPRPAELLYGQRMSARLVVFCPAASEHLRIAARATLELNAQRDRAVSLICPLLFELQ